MRKTFFQLFCLLTIGVTILSACNLPGGNAAADSTPPPEESTATIELTATQTEVVPTATPTVTPTETRISTSTATATPEPPIAEVGRESNCRIGPGGAYDLVATYQTGQMLEVVAKDLGGGTGLSKTPKSPRSNVICWRIISLSPAIQQRCQNSRPNLRPRRPPISNSVSRDWRPAREMILPYLSSRTPAVSHSVRLISR